MKKLIFCFDIDNVICRTKDSDYSNSKPIKKVIKIINTLYENDHYIKIFTARYMGRNNENFNKVNKKFYTKTKKILKKWGLKFNKLIMGKPSYHVFIDDKNFNFNKNWTKSFSKKYIKK
tara:strand:+ start:261 stop:617 length:357 start_codon:yes stop_codon:yes gene_type:complete